MALDNAEFISELSIVDPPGTDPLNQGDDHIRTTKKAVQQSFPNVGSAVPQTGAQMAQMAIKNEVNIFTQTNEFQSTQEFQSNIRFEIAAADRGLIWNNTTVRQWDLFSTGGGGLNDFRLRRYVGGVVQEDTIRIANLTGVAVFAKQTSFPAGIVAGASLFLNGAGVLMDDIADNQTATLNYRRNGFNRWRLVMRNDANNNNLELTRSNAAGVDQGTTLKFQANNGALLFGGQSIRMIAQTTGSASRFEFNDSTGAVRWRWDKLIETGDANLRLQGFNSAGVFLFTPMTFKQATQTINLVIPSSNVGLGSGDLFISSGFVAIVP